MAGLTNLKLLTDFFNKIGQERHFAPQKNPELFGREQGGAL
jgi:hypothetical protein